ncbi:MAG: hypothetical protein M3Y42_03940 [Actinomycetota bacterium]|nr:hypothetical protein [Actinomycetota bacterium]MDQ2956101.1 hypothetical protein [Actinomycetota bacterium]
MNRLNPTTALVMGGIVFAVLYCGFWELAHHGSWWLSISIAVVSALLWTGLMKLSGYGGERRRN